MLLTLGSVLSCYQGLRHEDFITVDLFEMPELMMLPNSTILGGVEVGA